jgi:hypothetical protein
LIIDNEPLFQVASLIIFLLLIHIITFTIMGIITIEIPQNITRKYRLVSEKSAKEILEKIEKLVQKENLIDDEDILGIWSDRKESKIKDQ